MINPKDRVPVKILDWFLYIAYKSTECCMNDIMAAVHVGLVSKSSWSIVGKIVKISAKSLFCGEWSDSLSIRSPRLKKWQWLFIAISTIKSHDNKNVFTRIYCITINLLRGHRVVTGWLTKNSIV